MIHLDSLPIRRLAASLTLAILLTLTAFSLTKQLIAEPIKQDPYPSPDQNGQPYPEPGSFPVLATDEPIDTTIIQGGEPTLSSPIAPPAGNPTGGLIFMWLGFMATLFMFIAAIIGSVLLFSRRNEQS